MVAASNDPKVANQTKQDQQSKQEQNLKQGTKAESVVKQERAQVRSDQNQVRTLVSTKETTRDASTASTSRRSSRQQPGSNRDAKPGRDPRHPGHKVGGESVQHERSDRIAFRQEGALTPQQRNQQPATAAAREQQDPWSALESVLEDTTPGAGREGRERESLESPLVGGDKQEAAVAPDQIAGVENGTVVAAPLDGIAPSEQIQPGAEQQQVSLEELIGPEATLSFREKMTELWNVLEEGSTAPLDVLAHMPLNIQGQSAMELLMVESPQGIHFVAFLRNSNDFEMLATFNRHALLPNSASRQLIEAALIAFQQIQTVAGQAAEKLAEELRKIAESEHEDVEKLGGVRAACLNAKRSKEGCAQAINSLLRTLEVENLPEDTDRSQAVELGGESSEVEAGRG